MANAYLGIDIAKEKFDVALLLDDKFKTKSFSNSNGGFEALVLWLEKYKCSDIHYCMEATGVYGEKLASFLFKKTLKVSVVNPVRIKAFGKSRLSRNKTDESDAKLIADFCKTTQPDLWTPIPEHINKLRNWVRRLDSLKSMKQQEQNRLEAACEEVSYSINGLINVLNNEIKFAEDKIKDCISSNEDLNNKDELIQSIPGVGPATSALVLCFLWDTNNFTNAKQVAAYAGLSPRQRQSGSSVNGRTMLSKIGDAQLRKGLYMPALSALRFNPVIREFSDRLTRSGKNKMQIIGAVMRKLLHLIYGVLKSNIVFNPKFA